MTERGEIRALAMTSDVDRLKIDTGSGSVRLQLTPGTGAHVHVDTGNGGVTCELPIATETKDDDSLIGTLGDGRGSIHIETGSGSVRLTLTGLAPATDLDFPIAARFGWNLIGSPFESLVALSTVKVKLQDRDPLTWEEAVAGIHHALD